jgi:hypothetical protein
MTEPKPIYDDGTCRSSTNAPDYVAKWNPSINGEPLSTKQLHEVIVSQSMTIDRLLGEVGECRAKNKHVCEWTGKYKHYHEITGDTLFRVRKTSCSDDHDDIVSVVDYTFCPNCGGQIKYIEET